MSARNRRRLFLGAFIVYFFDLVWKLIHWSQFFGDVSGWALLMAFGIRIAVLAFLVSQYQLAGQRLLQEADSSK